MPDNVNITVNETIENIVINPSISTDVIDVNTYSTTENVNIAVTPELTTVNINSVTSFSPVNSVNGQTGDVIVPTSDNNFTTVLKNKLDGIQSGAEVNVNADWNSTSGDSQILNKPSIPSISGLASVTYVDTQDALKVDKVAGKGLSTNDYTTVEQTKLAGIAVGAEVNVNADWNATTGDAQILNKPTIPTQTSQLTNNGADGTNPFITALDIPVGSQASSLVREVKNMTGATLTKGTVVYISGANGNKALVSKALAINDELSSRTFGLLQSNISNNALGNCVIIGDLSGLDTSAFTEGVQLYLSGVTAGTYTSTKTLAPTHLVYVGKVTRSHPTLGQIEVGIQNGYELSEIHDVALSSVANNQLLSYDSATSLWKNKSVTTADIADSTNKRYVTDANLTTIGNQSGTNTGDQDLTNLVVKNTAIVAATKTKITYDAKGLVTAGADATTADIADSSNKRYQTDNQQSFNDATSSIQTQINSKQSTLTNPITGTGTTNYLPKFTGTTALGNSLLYDDGTNVSIGTTSGLGLFNVTGSKTAASAIARGTHLAPTLVASANSDVLVGLDIAPTFTTTGFTGVVGYALRLGGDLGFLTTSNQIRWGVNSYISSNGSGIFNFGFNSQSTNGIINVNSISSLSALSGGFNTGTNVAGNDLSLSTRYGTGTGTPSNMNFSITQTTTSGSSAHTGLKSMSLFGQTGNLTLQNGGTFTDAGYRLDVNGTARVQGLAYLNSVIVGSTSLNPSAILQADSTTKGFLPPRMTNAQRIAIATPAIGLVVYCTDTTEGLYVNKSTGWVMLL